MFSALCHLFLSYLYFLAPFTLVLLSPLTPGSLVLAPLRISRCITSTKYLVFVSLLQVGGPLHQERPVFETETISKTRSRCNSSSHSYALWLEILHPFSTVKNIHLSEYFARHIVLAPQELEGRTNERNADHTAKHLPRGTPAIRRNQSGKASNSLLPCDWLWVTLYPHVITIAKTMGRRRLFFFGLIVTLFFLTSP